MDISLASKNILVTGASRGIGAAIARALGESGGRVAVHYNRGKAAAVKLAKTIGNGALAFRADLEKTGECRRLFDEVVGAFGRLDVLVNNAGVFVKSPLARPSWISDWDRTMAVNLRAAAVLSRLAIGHFAAQSAHSANGGGRIINIASRAAFRGDDQEYLAYAASKAGMVALSRSIARAFGKDNITSFVIAPGWVRTDMAAPSITAMGEKRIVADLALQKLTEPGDIAPMVVLLASGLADHATGATIDINAGSYVH
jgi:NAD(P)-dependent dehydrogenase (short-subunit alcohol dehydrogenase family)